MKYYSVILNKLFDSAEECMSAEKEQVEQEARKREEAKRIAEEEKAKKAQLAEERKVMAAKVEEKRKIAQDAQHDYVEAMKEFISKYGSYHYSTKDVKDIPYLFESLLDKLFI